MSIDLNCDLGESFGSYTIGNDDKIMDYITTANIACGYHAGDYVVMDKTVRMCIDKGIKIGAHPSFPDLQGFGRKNMNFDNNELRAMIIYQVGALEGFIKAYGGKLNHVKPHGALYNMAATSYDMSIVIARAVYDINPEIKMFALSGSQSVKAYNDVGIEVMSEVFADRAYNDDGSLVSRTKSGSVIHDIDICLERVKHMVHEQKVVSISGKEINIKADTICLHGDNISALSLAKGVYDCFNLIERL